MQYIVLAAVYSRIFFKSSLGTGGSSTGVTVELFLEKLSRRCLPERILALDDAVAIDVCLGSFAFLDAPETLHLQDLLSVVHFYCDLLFLILKEITSHKANAPLLHLHSRHDACTESILSHWFHNLITHPVCDP
jgi:hypothetical protein